MNDACVVTGLGCICAAGCGLDAVMESLLSGDRAPAPPRGFQVSLERPYPVFAIEQPLVLPDGITMASNFEPTRTALLALLAASEALAQTGLDSQALATRRVGVCLGTTVGCTLNNEPFYAAFRRGECPDRAPIQRYLDCQPARFVARSLGLRGPALVVANACSSGTDAIGIARDWIEAGLCDLAVAGGADELSRIPYLGFAHLLNMSDEPCRPFDRRRRGLNLGEGAGVLVLESRASAAHRGAAPLASIAGYASSCDAWHPTAPHPEGLGLRRAIAAALEQAGLPPSGIGFVNAHGTATADNDRVEGRVLADLFGEAMPIVATKGYTGHTLGAAGGIEAVLTVRCLADRRLPASAGYEEPDPDCRVRPTTAPMDCDAEAALSTSLAFGGNNAALVIRREPQ